MIFQQQYLTTNRKLDEKIAIELFGWAWMAWLGVPVKGTPDYPNKCRVRQLLSRSQLNNGRWQKSLKEMNAEPANGDEPLNYNYCSSGGSDASVPAYTTDANADYLVLVYVREKWGSLKLEAFAQELRHKFFDHWPSDQPAEEEFMPCWYEPGDYSRAALAVLAKRT